MTDKRRGPAEEIASDVFESWLRDIDGSISMGAPKNLKDKIAKAIEDYRNEGIEEAAKVSEETQWHKWGIDPLSPEMQIGFCGKDIANKIRALKRGGR